VIGHGDLQVGIPIAIFDLHFYNKTVGAVIVLFVLVINPVPCNMSYEPRGWNNIIVFIIVFGNMNESTDSKSRRLDVFIRDGAVYNGKINLTFEMSFYCFTGCDIVTFCATVATGARFLSLLFFVITFDVIAIGIICALFFNVPCSVRAFGSIVPSCPTIAASYGTNVVPLFISIPCRLDPFSHFLNVPPL